AEDGIRDFHVTGVQTCALPISLPPTQPRLPPRGAQTLELTAAGYGRHAASSFGARGVGSAASHSLEDCGRASTNGGWLPHRRFRLRVHRTCSMQRSVPERLSL